jgi:DNA polymerase-1
VEWQTVVNTYEKAGMTEEDALLNARMAFILRDGYYNKETKEIKLWTPTQ